jgi:1-acyl-sn-glycerol-3-phosphate acyltransferase
MLYEILKPLVVLLFRLLFRLEGRGTEHVPRAGSVMLVANHSSFLDPPLVGAVTPRPLGFLAKEELFRIPLFGRLIHALNARPLRRAGSDPRALRTALRVLEEGRALLVFPEGTRGDEGALRTPKAGAGMLAVLSGVPVVPVYVEGSGRVWPRGRRFPRRGKVIVRFGPPLRFERGGDGRERKGQYEAASRAMMDAIGALGPPDLRRTASGEPARRPSEVGFEYIHGRNGQHG